MSKDQKFDADNFQRIDPLEDGYDEVTCAIMQTHPEHLWNKPGDEPKICPGRS